MEFIESRPFTRELHHLAGEDADEVLKAIQGELEQKPDRGAMVPGLAGVRKARVATQVGVKESVVVTAICICTWRRGGTFTC